MVNCFRGCKGIQKGSPLFSITYYLMLEVLAMRVRASALKKDAGN